VQYVGDGVIRILNEYISTFITHTHTEGAVILIVLQMALNVR